MAEAEIFLDEALGTYDNIPPKELSERWLQWKSSYPSEYQKLNSSVTAKPTVTALNALSASIIAYETAVTAISTVKTTYTEAKQAYDDAMSALSGGTGAAAVAAKVLLDEAVTVVKETAKTLYSGAKETAHKLTNLKVSADTRLDS